MNLIVKADQLAARFMGRNITIEHKGNTIKGVLTDLSVEAHPRLAVTYFNIPVGYDRSIQATVDGTTTVECQPDDTITISMEDPE